MKNPDIPFITPDWPLPRIEVEEQMGGCTVFTERTEKLPGHRFGTHSQVDEVSVRRVLRPDGIPEASIEYTIFRKHRFLWGLVRWNTMSCGSISLVPKDLTRFFDAATRLCDTQSAPEFGIPARRVAGCTCTPGAICYRCVALR